MRFDRFLSFTILCSLFAFHAQADDLTLYAYKSPYGIDWKTPQRLAWSTIKNNFAKDSKLRSVHSIGHMNIALNCSPTAVYPDGLQLLIGQTNSDNKEMERNLLKKGYGLGIMLTAHKGKWENPKDILHDLKVYFKRGDIRFVQFQISSQTCERVAEYLKEYQERGFDQIYGGLQHRARLGEGAGCSAFSQSILEVAGVMAPEWNESWTRSVFVPNNLIGGPITGNKVNILKLLMSTSSLRWNKNAKHSFALTFWDPEKVYTWIDRAYRRQMNLSFHYQKTKKIKAKGIAIDASKFSTPTDPFWQN